MKKIKPLNLIAVFCTFVLICAIFVPFLPLSGESDIYNEAVRLHVLANSNTEEDQELKLKVRNCVLEVLKEKMSYAKTKDEAIKIINNNTAELKQAAIDCIEKYGYDYNVELTLTEEYYPTRIYAGVSMPKGRYTSLRILIGEATGRNWWCVLYPPLCTSAAEPKSTLSEAGFTPAQVRILTEGENPKYKIKFKFLEMFSSIKEIF